MRRGKEGIPTVRVESYFIKMVDVCDEIRRNEMRPVEMR